MSMTNEEMHKRWPRVPPFEIESVRMVNSEGRSMIKEVNQDTIQEIIEYFEACAECMNG